VVEANKRLRNANYAAQTDNLRRTMEATRSGGVKRLRKSWTWRHYLVMLGGLVWWGSLLVEMAGHVFGTFPLAVGRGSPPQAFYGKVLWCLADLFESRSAQSDCYQTFTGHIWTAIYLSILTVWWNPKLLPYLSSRTGILRGQQQYYALQALMLAIRWATTYYLETSVPLFSDMSRGTHFTMLLLLIVTTGVALTTVTVEEKPLVSFTGLKPITAEPSSMLTPRRPFHTEAHTETSFPISALSNSRQRSPSPDQGYETASVATSIDSSHHNWAEQEDDMSMEWTPTQQSTTKALTPRRPVQPLKQPNFGGPSPFYGTLPPAPMAPSVKARKPLQPFIPASQEKKDNFFQQVMGSSTGNTNMDFGGSKRIDYSLREPQLRDRRAETAETGLEGLFDSSFSLGAPGPSKSRKQPGLERGVEPEVPGLQRGHVYEGEAVRWGVMIRRLLTGIVLTCILGFGGVWCRGWILKGVGNVDHGYVQEI
jgi:hypothetical protein